MSSASLSLLLVGLPASGKSTYLAALFHSLKEAGGDLSLRELPEEREYLLTLESKWLALEPVGHSAYPTPRQIDLPIREADANAVDIRIPDINGEEFRDAWESGEWSEPLKALLDAAEGIVLFVRANDVQAPALIEVGVSRTTSESQKPADWHPRMATTQAKLCDLLEQMSERRGGRLPAVAIVVSAWDAVDEGLEPGGWVTWKLPLLNQWLQASDVVSRFEIFGISAQGGDIEDPATRDALAQLPRTERPGGAHQLSEPLKWLLASQ